MHHFRRSFFSFSWSVDVSHLIAYGIRRDGTVSVQQSNWGWGYLLLLRFVWLGTLCGRSRRVHSSFDLLPLYACVLGISLWQSWDWNPENMRPIDDMPPSRSAATVRSFFSRRATTTRFCKLYTMHVHNWTTRSKRVANGAVGKNLKPHPMNSNPWYIRTFHYVILADVSDYDFRVLIADSFPNWIETVIGRISRRRLLSIIS